MTSPAPDFGSGLIPAIVQDASDGTVRMLGMMNQEAWERSLATGKVHFWSRSRQRLWMKGETSGNTLGIRSISLDCDADAILIQADPVGPTCHEGNRSCFDTEPILPGRGETREPDTDKDQPRGDQAASGNQTLGRAVDTLVQTVISRRNADPSDSYTAQLLADADLAARKVLEEAGEVAFAAKDHERAGDPTRIIEEAADLLYHLVALLEHHDVDARQVAAELERRRA